MASTSVDEDDDKTVQFHDMGIDDRILEVFFSFMKQLTPWARTDNIIKLDI